MPRSFLLPMTSLLLAICSFVFISPAFADYVQPSNPYPLFDEGKLLATSGVNQVEGAGGGGLVPWALITGYDSRDGIGVDAHDTFVQLRNYTLHSAGAAVGFYDRLEISFAHQWFDTRSTGAALGLGRDFTFEQNVFGAKLRLFGNAVYDQDAWWPQTAIGIQYKSNDRGDILKAVGAKDADGTDFYISATKLLLDYSVLVDTTIRLTRANQLGILGFGSSKDDSYQAEFEGSAAYLFTRRFATGVEFRMKPDNLGFAKEQNAFDVFGAYFFNKNISLTLAYADLGSIATRNGQRGIYASLQIAR